MGKRTQIVEVTVPDAFTGYKINFQDQPYLRGQFITGISAYTVEDIPKTPQGNDLIDLATMGKVFLTLWIVDINPDGTQKSGGEWISQIPLLDLHLLQNSTNTFNRRPFVLDNQVVAWEKSYYTFSEALNNSGAKSIMVNVTFEPNPNYQGN